MINMELIEEFYKQLEQLVNKGTYDADARTLSDIKFCLFKYKDEKEVKEAKKLFATYLNNIFSAKELNESFNIEETYKYYKQIAIYKNNPFFINPNIKLFFNDTIFIPEPTYMEDNVNWFLEDNGFKHNDNLDKLKEFEKNNKHIIKSDKYGTIEEETERYKKVIEGNYTDPDFKEFENDRLLKANLAGRSYDGYIEMDYLNKKIGNIGELYVYNALALKEKTTFVSRDLGDGFGYDIYTTIYTNNIKKELLIEVKSTSSEDKNFFFLSDNERKVMAETLKNENAEYIICKSYIDVLNNIKENEYYRAVDENTFIPLDSLDEYSYDTETGLYMDKQKILKK